MVNLLIANDNINNIQEILNIITPEYENIRLINISTNTSEAILSMKKYFPDIILKCDKKFNFNTFINEENNFYSPTIIDMTKRNSMTELRHYITKINKTKKIKATKKEIKEEEFKILSNKIYHRLLSINFNAQMQGTYLLSECIAYTYLHKDDNVLDCMNRNLYPVIGEKHNKTPEAVKWDVIKTLQVMYRQNKKENPAIIENFLNMQIEMKQTPKFFITHFLHAL